MTMIVIAVSTHGVAFVADRLMTPDDGSEPWPDRKLFKKGGRFIAGFFGKGNKDVPGIMDEIPIATETIEEVARKVVATFAQVPTAQRCEFGVLLAGFRGGCPVVLQVNVPSGMGGFLERVGMVEPVVMPNHLWDLAEKRSVGADAPIGVPVSEALSLAAHIQRKAPPKEISADFDHATVSVEGARLILATAKLPGHLDDQIPLIGDNPAAPDAGSG
jgi:hypothetical protein